MIKKILVRFRNIMVYAGLDREQYDSIKEDIVSENMGLLKFAALRLGHVLSSDDIGEHD